MLKLSRAQARRIMIGAQQLAGQPPKRPTKAKMREVIQGLGALQIDSISVVARSHHIVMWSRLGNHPPEWLTELHGEDGALFEYWAHAAAFVPIELFPYSRGKMLSFPSATGHKQTRAWIADNQELLDDVVRHIREHGPVTTKSFNAPDGAERAAPWAWYGNKPTNLALDILWYQGVLMVARRDKFQRVYDLTERVHPAWCETELPSDAEVQRTLAETTLHALGVVSEWWMPDYFRPDWSSARINRQVARDLFVDLVDRELAVPVEIEGVPGETIASTALLNRRFRPSRTTLLSPFDSLVWDRRRVDELWDFELQLEAYTPAHKRRYGYFSLPILYRDQLVGRLDPKADRKARVLYVNALHLEPSFAGQDDDQFYAELARTLLDFSAFNDVDDVRITRSDPPDAAERLRAALVELQ